MHGRERALKAFPSRERVFVPQLIIFAIDVEPSRILSVRTV